MLKQILAVVAGFTVAVAVFAADAELRDDHPDTYIVQKGDTLWDISGRFLKQPWLWPEIWQANPQVANPHLIYPGDKLNLVYVDGHARLIMGSPEGGFGPRVRRESLDEAVTAIPLSEVLPFLQKYRVLEKDSAKKLPYVVASEENRLLASEGMRVYVRGLDAAPGTRITVMRPTYEFWEVPDNFPWGSSKRHPEATEITSERGHSFGQWAERLTMPGYRSRTEFLGQEFMEVAQGEVLRTGDPSTVLVRNADLEVKKGDVIIVGDPMAFDLTFAPHAPPSVPDNMRVMSLTYQESLRIAGPRQVVALSRGARDGVDNGQVYSIFEPGETVRDDIGYAQDDTRTIFKKSKGKVTLPDEFVGHVMIFRTFDKVSYGLVMNGIRPIKLGDKLQAPVN